MSDESTVTQVYAIDDSRPPEAWVCDWVMYQGQRVSGGDVPEGFWQVSHDEYLEALSYQQSASDSLQQSAIIADDLNNGIAIDPAPDEEPID